MNILLYKFTKKIFLNVCDILVLVIIYKHLEKEMKLPQSK